MKKEYKKFETWQLLMLLAVVFVISSCEKDETPFSLYDGDSTSVDEVRSLEIYPGENRVLIKGVVDDPSVSEVRIFWEDESESVVVPVNTTTGPDTINELIEGLEEKLYIFEVQSLDESGNMSEGISGGAKVFGAEYANSLVNRTLVSNELIDSTLDIEFGAMDESSGVIGTELLYENMAGEEQSRFVELSTDNFSIPDFNNGSTYRYRSVYVPSAMAIDTFYTAYDSFTPVAIPQLTNAEAPFEVAEASGRWGTLAHWITNDAVKNHDGYGGYDANNGFNIESGWGAPGIVNGKIYQTVTAGAATFTLNVQFNDNNYSADDEGGYYLVVAKGDGLPDVEDIPTAPEVLGYERVTSSNMEYNIPFTVDEMTTISVGVVTTQDDSGRYGPINSFVITAGN